MHADKSINSSPSMNSSGTVEMGGSSLHMCAYVGDVSCFCRTSRLQVHLLFTPRKPSSDPALKCLLHLPILVDYSVGFWTKKDGNLALAAIFHYSRVRGIALAGPCASRLLRELCHPFPKLESFEFCFPFKFSTPYHMHELIIPATFLLPAPCLRRPTLREVVPTCLSPLLSSATGLVELALTLRVRHSVLPDACVLPDTSLIANLQRLSCLRRLELKLANQDIAIAPDTHRLLPEMSFDSQSSRISFLWVVPHTWICS